MTDFLIAAYAHPWWVTLWLAMTFTTLVETVRQFKRKGKP